MPASPKTVLSCEEADSSSNATLDGIPQIDDGNHQTFLSQDEVTFSPNPQFCYE